MVRGQRIVNGQPYATEGDLAGPPIAVIRPAPDRWMRRLGTVATLQDVAGPQAYTPLLTEATLDDDAATLTPGWTPRAASDAQGGSCRVLTAGNSTDSATWSFGPINPGVYRVMISWPPSIPIPVDASFTLTDASSTVVSVSPAGATQVGTGAWRDLGNFSLGPSLDLQLRGAITGQVVADAARIGARNSVTISALKATDIVPANGMGRRATVVPRP